MALKLRCCRRRHSVRKCGVQQWR